MTEPIWIMVIWFGFGTGGLGSYDAFRGGAAPISEVRYDSQQQCEKAAKTVMESNKHMKSFRLAAVECIAVPRSATK